jgi:hypothetical protein
MADIYIAKVTYFLLFSKKGIIKFAHCILNLRFAVQVLTMNKKSILFAVLITLALNVSSQNDRKDLFISPLRDTPSLSASFAELRNDHFHSGLDYKTGGVTGKEVLAAAEGYVYRIAVSPTGFGKALYIRHPSGYSTVYAHLNSFRPDIEAFVKKKQYELRSYSVSLFPLRDQFRIKQGEVIAWSGNTGGSTGPHLHFEVRESSSEDPINPLDFDMHISDRVRPVIDKIIIYPLTRSSSVNNSHSSLTIRAVPADGSYALSSASMPVVYGETGIGIKCWDSFDNSPNRCGIYSIEMTVDSLRVYRFTADRFSYTESHYLNSHIDYRAKMTSNEYIHRLFLQPGNKLAMYNTGSGRGILRLNDDRDHRISIVVTDAAGNRSWVNFTVRSLPAPPISPLEITCSKIIPYGRASDFTADGIRIHFPAGALYDTLFFVYNVRNSNGTFLSPIHSVHDETVPIDDRYRLSIRPDTVFTGQEDKLCLAAVSRKGIPSYAGGELRYGFVSADVTRLGDYAVAIDTVPPNIKPSFVSGTDLTGRKAFIIVINDDFSGIKSYEALIDGAWALAEYDAKNNLLIFRPEEPYIKENTLHRLELKVTDNRGNSSVLKSEFRW